MVWRFDTKCGSSTPRRREWGPIVLYPSRGRYLLSKGRAPLIQGITTVDGVPAAVFEVGSQRWQAIIDTGFNGELELPERLRAYVNARFVGRVTSLLAANQRIEEDLFLVDFPFDGQMVRAQATFVDGDEILIGTQMLQDYRLQIDFPARTVSAEKAQLKTPP